MDVLRLVKAEDATVAPAVGAALPELARAVDLVVAALRAGGRLHYIGAGTSGRIAAMDAEELGPTYGLEPGRVVAHVAPYEPTGGAGGRPEDGEDDDSRGAAVGAQIAVGDVAVGIAASGRTPYVVAALAGAAAVGARTVLVSSNPRAPLGRSVDVHICVDTGPEVVTGSTRLKAGTAQKLVLNALSTTALVQLGRTWSNLMIGAVVSNEKLRGRLVNALVGATGEDAATCARALAATDGEGRTALLCLLAGVAPEPARAALAASGGAVRPALLALTAPDSAGMPG
jgi:N-acetylmuramic acid 6-phosphate etherase